MCRRVVHSEVTSKTRKYQVSIIVAYGESKCKMGQEKSSNYLGNAASFLLLLSIFFPPKLPM